LAAPRQPNNSRQSHVLGVSLLLLGDPDRSVAELRAADRPAARNDLAVALLEQGARDDSPARAAEALETLLAADGAREAARERLFNSALALERIGLLHRATAQWERLLTITVGQGWERKATDHIAALRRQLDAAPAIAAEKERRVLDETLASWASAVGAGRLDDARASLQMAGDSARQYRETHDDGSLETVVAAAAASVGQAEVARGHLAYVTARKRYRAGDPTGCVEAATHAISLLDASDSALAASSRVTAAGCAWLRHEYERADVLAAQAADRAARSGWHVLEGQATWLRGLTAAARRRPDEALEHYSFALRAFDRGRDMQRRAAVLGLQADLLDYLGRGEDAWRSLAEGLAIRQADPVRDYEMAASLTALASREGLPEVALQAAKEALSRARTSGMVDQICDARMRLGDAHRALSQLEEAKSEYQGARTAAAAIADPALRRRMGAHVGVRLAEVFADESPDQALAWLEESEPGGEADHFLRAALLRSRVLLGRGARHGAEASLRAAVEASRREEVRLRTLAHRDELFAEREGVRQALVALLVDDGRAEEALAVVDEWREPLGAPGGRVGRPTRPRPERVTFLSLPDRLLVWHQGDFGTRVVQRRVSQAEILALVSTAVRELRSGAPAAAMRSLSRLLLGGLDLQRTGTLLLSADPVLFAVPWAALPVPSGSGPLVEHRTPVITNHPVELASVVLSPDRCVLLARGAGAGPSSSKLAALPQVNAELSRVAALYPCRAEARRPVDIPARLDGSVAVLHFAGHSEVRADGVGTLLFNEGSDVLAAGPREVEQWPLTGVVVVLSSCSGAEGRISATAGRDGLVQAFLEAGAKAVIANVWPVADVDALAYSTELHRRLAAGEEVTGATRAAQLVMVSSGRPPAAWAGWRVQVGNTAHAESAAKGAL
jgi:tetratricopeptide (TPR) repeat protein